MTETVVETHALTKEFGDVKAVDRLDFSVKKGEMFCLVGPDGAGKTTTLRMLCGILRPTSGYGRVLGYDVQKEAEKIKRHIGYLSQRFTLYRDLTVDENIEFFAEVHFVRNYRERREELLNFLRLKPFRSRLAENLSGGMKQKLALACTLIHTPDVLLLDEPTTGVDPVSRREFWIFLSRLLRNGMTILMATPYMDEAERSARVALMDKGIFLVADTPQRVKSCMKGRVIEIVSEDIRRAFSVLENMKEEVQMFGDRINVIVEDPDRGWPSIRAKLEAAGIVISSWREVPSSLENVFISLTKKRHLSSDN